MKPSKESKVSTHVLKDKEGNESERGREGKKRKIPSGRKNSGITPPCICWIRRIHTLEDGTGGCWAFDFGKKRGFCRNRNGVEDLPLHTKEN